MATVKISAMAAAGALNGTEILPIVQGGANKEATTANVAALGNAYAAAAANAAVTVSEAYTDTKLAGATGTIDPGAVLLPNGKVVVGQGSGQGSAKSFSGDATIDANGEVTINGLYLGTQTITAAGAGVYTPSSARVRAIVIELLGAGGGGSGVSSPGISKTSIGGGGNGAFWGRKRLTANFAGAAYVVGAKGTGGAAGANAGTNGTATSFTTTAAVVYSVSGGSGAGSVSAATPPTMVNNNPGVNGVLSVNFDVIKPPYGADEGVCVNAAINAFSGPGGSSMYGSGGYSTDLTAINTSAVGTAGSGYGAGGSGAVALGTGVARAGGDGTDGIIIIHEYS